MRDSPTKDTYANNAEVRQISELLTKSNTPSAEGRADPRDNESHDQPGAELLDNDQESSDSESQDGQAPELTDQADPIQQDPDLVDPAGDTEGEQLEDPDHAPTLHEIAETLEVDTKYLYDVEIPLGNDRSVALAELKDGFKKFETYRATEAEFVERKAQAENENMIAKRQIEQLIRLAPAGAITGELLSKLDEIHSANVARERSAIIKAIPEWRDSNQRQIDFEEIAEVMAGYGFSSSEIEGAMDARLVKFCYDMTKRINLAKRHNGGKPLPTNVGKGRRSHKPKASPLTARIVSAKKSRSMQEKIGVVSELINQKS